MDDTLDRQTPVSANPEPDSGGESRARGRPGGADSRDRILDNAGRLFAERGYNGVSMRDLATAAKVNLGAVNYHFGGKRSLYQETVRRLIDDIGPHFGPIIRQLREDVAAAGGDREKLAACTARFVRALYVAVLGGRVLQWQMPFLLREFHQPSREFAMILADRINPMHDAVASLVAAALGRDKQDPEITIRVHAFIGQIMSFGACRAIVFARLGWDEYTPARIALVADTVIPSILGSLGLPLPVGPNGEES
ncbi:MAG: CerR family C-terminal domain-containing protein [Alphaproteobacteria bacterium]